MSRPRQDPAQATPTPYQGKDGDLARLRPDGLACRRSSRPQAHPAQDPPGGRPGAASTARQQRDRGEYIHSSKDTTLGWWATHWLDELLPLAGRKAKTIEGYRSTLKVHVLPHLAGVKLSALTRGSHPRSAHRHEAGRRQRPHRRTPLTGSCGRACRPPWTPAASR